MKKKITMLLMIVCIVLACNLVSAETNVTMNVVSDEKINSEQSIISTGNVSQIQEVQAGGDVRSSHYYDAGGSTYLYLNGEPIEDFGNNRLLAVEQTIETNDVKWSSDNGMDRDDVVGVFQKAVNYLFGVGSSFRDYEVELAELLYSAFVPRYEVEQMYENLDARLAVWEKWVEEYDHENYCHVKAMVAQERGYTDFHCHEDEWYHIEPDYTEGIRVEQYVPPEEE